MAEHDTGAAVQAGGPAVDNEHPWLGLDSFNEHSSAYFYGRDEEVAELARRVQRKLLTVLFGQSGLGKTSILRAGIVPRLRPQGYCPVYVRIDYAADAPSPAAQLKQAILRATAELGSWTRPGSAEANESLWEFLHHRADVLLDHQGRPLIPLLIFDQFEEIFTLAQADDAGRKRAAEFIAELADLVENRPPRALEAELESDELLTEEFDFARSDYRILIALREDYLAHLEGVKGAMPSITQNRMRLARMTGAQALAAVTLPGGSLVSEEVAAAIVRFIAGGAELANAEVEPSLLSLICRELNNARLAQGRAAISTDLLAGSHASILSEFYARALADQPPGVARLIEDQLLTEGGFRENLAEERVRNGFAAAGAAPEALAVLVNRRLLRIEERLDVRRVELTHDVLCSVVRAARESRKERELREEADRQLELQAERERATRKSLRRARQVAAVCAVLTIGAVGSAAFGYAQLRAAKQTRATAERSRAEAEKLIGYLLDDFYDELQPIGKSKLLAELANRTSAYYRDLPLSTRTPDTELNRAFTLQRLGAIQRTVDQFDASNTSLLASIAVLEPMVARGNAPERVQLRLADALLEHSYNDFLLNGKAADALAQLGRATELARPFARAPQATPQARRIYADTLLATGVVQLRSDNLDAAIATFRATRTALSKAGATPGAPAEALQYAEAVGWLQEALIFSGQEQEASALAQEALQVIEQVMQSQPNNVLARGLRHRLYVQMSENAWHLRKAGIALAQLAEAAGDSAYLMRIDPDNGDYRDARSNDLGLGAMYHFLLGQPESGQQQLQQSVALYHDAQLPPYQCLNQYLFTMYAATSQAEQNQLEELQRTVALMHRYGEQYSGSKGAMPSFALTRQRDKLALDLLSGAAPVSGEAIADLIRSASNLLATAEQKKDAANGPPLRTALVGLYELDAAAAYERGEQERAEASSNKGLTAAAVSSAFTASDLAKLRTTHAMALAGLGRHREALAEIQSVLKGQRALLARGADDQYLRIELAQSLYAAALAQPQAGRPELSEARATLAALPEVMRRYRSVKLWRKRIKALQQERGE